MKISVVLNRGKKGADCSEAIKSQLEQILGKPCYVIIRKDNSRINTILKKGNT